MKDKLPELKKRLQASGVDSDGWVETFFEGNSARLSEDTNHFLHTSFEVQADLDELRQLTKSMKEQHSLVITETRSSSEVQRNIETLEMRLKKKTNTIKDKLKDLEEEYETHGRYLPGPEVRMQRDQISALTRLFQEELVGYNSVLLAHREHCKRRLQRQLSISGCKKTDEEVEDMIETGQLTVLVSAQISVEFEDAKTTLAAVEARHNDILKLEESITALYDMFLDMSIQISQQNEMLDRIEFNVQTAVDFLHEALPSLRKAHQYKASNPLVQMLGCYGALRLCCVM